MSIYVLIRNLVHNYINIQYVNKISQQTYFVENASFCLTYFFKKSFSQTWTILLLHCSACQNYVFQSFTIYEWLTNDRQKQNVEARASWPSQLALKNSVCFGWPCILPFNAHNSQVKYRWYSWDILHVVHKLAEKFTKCPWKSEKFC